MSRGRTTPEKRLAKTFAAIREEGASLREIVDANEGHNSLWPETQYSVSLLNSPTKPWTHKEITQLFRVVGGDPLVDAHNALLKLHNATLKQLSNARETLFEEREALDEVKRRHETYKNIVRGKLNRLNEKLEAKRGIA